MSQDLDQIVLLIGAVLGGGFALPFLMAALEPKPLDAAPTEPRTPLLSLARLMLARRVLGARPTPAVELTDAA